MNPSLKLPTAPAGSSESSQWNPFDPQPKLAAPPGCSSYLPLHKHETVRRARGRLLLLEITQWAVHRHNPSIMSWSLETFLDTLRQMRIRHAIYHQQHKAVMLRAGAVPSLCAFCCLRERAKMGVPVKHGTKQNGWLFSSNKNGFARSKEEKKNLIKRKWINTW